MRKIFVSLAIVILITMTALAQEGVSVAGEWDLTLETPAGIRQVTLLIKQAGGKLRGRMVGPRGEQALENLTLSGDEISFAMTVQFQGRALVTRYRGKVENGMMKGGVDFGGMGSGTWSAVPHQEIAPVTAAPVTPPAPAAAPTVAATDSYNISGVWNFAVETAAGSGNPLFVFKQEDETLTGTYKGALGEAPLTGTVKGSEVRFSFKVNVQGQEAEVVYTGKIESATTMKGAVKLGDLGEGTWTGKKQ